MMNFISGTLVSLSALLSVTLAQPSLSPSPQVPLPPSQDQFYTAPPNYQESLPGTILRIRCAPGNLTSAVANSSSAYNILYRTTDTNEKPAWAVTTLYLPLTTSKRSTANSLLSYQVAYDSASVDASPSFSFYTSPMPTISEALRKGWWVNVPDYEGPLASFACGVQSGHATLDSVRAVLSSKLGLAADARYAMWGYSGGSIASEFAAELQPTYAPELNFAGAVLGGVVSNGSHAIDAVNGAPFAALIPASYMGVASQHKRFYQHLLATLKKTGPHNASTILSFTKLDFAAGNALFAFHNIYDYFIHGAADMQIPWIHDLFFKESQMGFHGVPTMPIFAYKAIADQITPIADTDFMVDRYCSIGEVNILYQRNTVGDHLAEVGNRNEGAFQWLSSVLEGSYSHTGCTIQNVTITSSSAQPI